jgi:multiple sugar transport system ATP-binding protein
VAKVQLTNLVKQYSAFYAVDHVSLTIEHGEFVALVGPSGCGKTTTLNLVAGLIERTSGDIRIGERLVNDLDPKDRDIAMVFQNYALYPNKSVFKNLAFPLTMRKMSRPDIDRKVREAAKVLDIEHLLNRLPRELSGGQQQRVALGRAMVRNPAAFLMDEPLSNLDAKLRVQMRTELKRFHQDMGATVIYVTHDQLEAVTMADRMAVMKGGVLQQYDSPAHVFANPANVFVAGFVGSPAMNLLSAEVVNGAAPMLRGMEGWTVPLSDANARKALSSSTSQVVLGARHGTILLHQQDTPGAVPGRIYTVEPTGDITYAYVTLGSSTLVVSVAPSVILAPDQPVWLTFDQDRIHLFDGATQQVLAAA